MKFEKVGDPGAVQAVSCPGKGQTPRGLPTWLNSLEIERLVLAFCFPFKPLPGARLLNLRTGTVPGFV